MTSNRAERLIAGAAAVFVLAGVVGLFTLAVLVVQVRDAVRTTDQVLEAVEPDPLVQSWTLEWLTVEATVNEGVLEAAGTFRCSDNVPAETLIQFESSLRPVPTEGAPSLQRVVQLPIRAGLVCSDQPVEFPVPWSQLIGLDALMAPADFRLEIEATAVGFETARAESPNLVTITP